MAKQKNKIGRWADRAPSMREVAALAGCSSATVSRALNGIPVRPQHEKRILAAAATLGYVPNAAARNIRGYSSMTVGIVINSELHPGLEILPSVNSIVGAMEAKGYVCMVTFPSGGSNEIDQVLRRFVERRVDGLFFWNACASDALKLYQTAKVPVLAVGSRDDACAHLPLVGVSHEKAFRSMFDRLKALGHRSIVELTPTPNPYLSGHEAAAVACGLSWQALHVGTETAEVRTAIRDLWARPDRPTAVLGTYPTCLQVYAACEAEGISIPGDLSVASVMESFGASFLRTPLTAIDNAYDVMCRTAWEAMLQALAGRKLKDQIIDAGAGWIERKSIGPAPSTRRRGSRT